MRCGRLFSNDRSLVAKIPTPWLHAPTAAPGQRQSGLRMLNPASLFQMHERISPYFSSNRPTSTWGLSESRKWAD